MSETGSRITPGEEEEEDHYQELTGGVNQSEQGVNGGDVLTCRVTGSELCQLATLLKMMSKSEKITR